MLNFKKEKDIIMSDDREEEYNEVINYLAKTIIEGFKGIDTPEGLLEETRLLDQVAEEIVKIQKGIDAFPDFQMECCD